MARRTVENPVIVLEDEQIVIIVNRDELDNETADTQSYTKAAGEYSKAVPYASWLKFRPWLTVVDPPQEFRDSRKAHTVDVRQSKPL